MLVRILSLTSSLIVKKDKRKKKVTIHGMRLLILFVLFVVVTSLVLGELSYVCLYILVSSCFGSWPMIYGNLMLINFAFL